MTDQQKLALATIALRHVAETFFVDVNGYLCPQSTLAGSMVICALIELGEVRIIELHGANQLQLIARKRKLKTPTGTANAPHP